jgi:hypothetical protein
VRRALSPVLLLGLAALASACGGGASEQPVISEGSLVGTWSGPQGSMTFLADHTFHGSDLRFDAQPQGCTKFSGPGTWQFISSRGQSGASLTTYRKGSVIEVNMNGSLDSCDFDVTTWQVNGPVGLGYFADPDSPCISPAFARVRAKSS